MTYNNSIQYGNLQSNVKGVIQASNLALVNTEWLFSGTGPDGKPLNIDGKATDVLRQQSDGTWRIIIDNPWDRIFRNKSRQKKAVGRLNQDG